MVVVVVVASLYTAVVVVVLVVPRLQPEVPAVQLAPLLAAMAARLMVLTPAMLPKIVSIV